MPLTVGIGRGASRDGAGPGCNQFPAACPTRWPRRLTMRLVGAERASDDWLVLTDEPLDAETAMAWVARPDCGAIVLFSGTVRNHADGRTGVTELTYEAYEEHVVPRLASIAAQARERWPVLGRVVAWHRTGALTVGECSVLVVVSAPHRAEAFDAAEWIIDVLKASVPIWKQETWEGGRDWGTGASAVSEGIGGGRKP